jgi:nucleoside-diphosphate-sugar epimerase
MITILGADGFIGSHLVRRLQELRLACHAPERKENLPASNLGDVIYCIGLTSDFRSRPFDTVTAHVCKLLEVLRNFEFDSLLYVSSTRLYGTRPGMATEEEALQIAPLNPNDLYNISKALGESLSFACGKKVRVARLSNVYGNDFTSNNFLSSIITEAISTKNVTLQTSGDSEKDYININDAVDGLIKIALGGRYDVYNVASGTNVSNEVLVKKIGDLTGCGIHIDPGAPRVSFPRIDIERIRGEFGFKPSNVLDDLAQLIESYKRYGA